MASPKPSLGNGRDGDPSYLDTSALVKRYDPEEPGAEEVRALFTRVRAVLTSSLAMVEAISAFRIKERQGVFTPKRCAWPWRPWRPTLPCSTAWYLRGLPKS